MSRDFPDEEQHPFPAVRDAMAAKRDLAAQERDRTAEDRDRDAVGRKVAAASRLEVADRRDREAEVRDRAAEGRDADSAEHDEGVTDPRIEQFQTDMDRFWSGRERDAAAVNRADAQDDLRAAALAGLAAREDREASRLDREDAQRDRDAAAAERDEAAGIIGKLREALRSRAD